MENHPIVFLSEFDPPCSSDLECLRFGLLFFDASSALIYPIASCKRIDVAPFKVREKLIHEVFGDYPNVEIAAKERCKTAREIIDNLTRQPVFGDKKILLVNPKEVESLGAIISHPKVKKLYRVVSILTNSDDDMKEVLLGHGIEVIINTDVSPYNQADIRSLSSLDAPKCVIDTVIKNQFYSVDKVVSLYDLKRYQHALSVAQLSYEMAQKNNVEPWKAYLAGYLHDVAKLYAKTDEGRDTMKRVFPEYAFMSPWSWHQFLGAYLSRTRFKIKDEEILHAIEFHTTGSGRMSKLDMIVYCADKLDPRRGWDSDSFIRLCKQDIEIGFKAELRHNIDFIQSQNSGEVADPLTQSCIEAYLN